MALRFTWSLCVSGPSNHVAFTWMDARTQAFPTVSQQFPNIDQTLVSQQNKAMFCWLVALLQGNVLLGNLGLINVIKFTCQLFFNVVADCIIYQV